MAGLVVRLYRAVFARKMFWRFNALLYRCSLRGIGVMNYESDRLSGEAKFIKSVVPSRGRFVVFDVGANVGKYSKMIRAANRDALICAFEPGARAFGELRKMEDSDLFAPLNVALGSEVGTLALYDYTGAAGSSHASMYREVFTSLYHQDTVAQTNVAVETLDRVIQARGLQRIDLLKLDVEGHELNVLRGGIQSLRSGLVRMIHFEFNSNNVISRTFFRDFWDFLPNFRFYRMLPGGLVEIEKYDPLMCEIFAYQNIVAVLRDE